MVNKSVNLDKFNKALDKFAKKTMPLAAQEQHLAVARVVWDGLIENTPVLTGRARRNWNANVGIANITTTRDVANVSSTGAPTTVDEKARFNMITKVIRSLPLGQRIVLSNALEYVPFLEAGSSAKAPQGIIQPALARVGSVNIGVEIVIR